MKWFYLNRSVSNLTSYIMDNLDELKVDKKLWKTNN